VPPYPVKIDSGGKTLTDADYRVEKMQYGKQDKDKDLTTLHYNDKIPSPAFRWKPTTTS
jgi:hypothetical protein